MLLWLFAQFSGHNQRIRPYLFDYPFNSKNIQIRIVVKNPDGSSIDNGKLSFMSAIGNILEYFIRESENFLLETTHRETFDEGVQKIGKEPVKENKGLVLKSRKFI